MKKKLTPEQKEAKRLSDKKYREANKEKERERLKKWREANKDKVKEHNKTRAKQISVWANENKERLKEYNKQYRKTKKENNPQFKLYCTIQNLIYNSLKRKKSNKNDKTVNILGCTIEEFKAHLESQFESWMSWENYGKYKKDCINYGWDIDHIKPIATAKNEVDLIKLNHYTNLRPLCSYVNRYVKRDVNPL